MTRHSANEFNPSKNLHWSQTCHSIYCEDISIYLLNDKCPLITFFCFQNSPAESPTTLCQSNYSCSFWLCLKMDRFIYWLYPTKSMQINIVIGGKSPNPHIKSYFINQSGLKDLVGDSAVLPKIGYFLPPHKQWSTPSITHRNFIHNHLLLPSNSSKECFLLPINQ